MEESIIENTLGTLLFIGPFYLAATISTGVMVGLVAAKTIKKEERSLIRAANVVASCLVGFVLSLVIGLLLSGATPDADCTSTWDDTCALGWTWYGARLFAVTGLLSGIWLLILLRNHVRPTVLLPLLGLVGGLSGGMVFGVMQDMLLITMTVGSNKWTEWMYAGHCLFWPLISGLMALAQVVATYVLHRRQLK